MTPIEQTAAYLRLFVEPDQVTELRAIYPTGEILSGYFDSNHLLDMAKVADELSARCKGVYFVPNPLDPKLLARSPNRAAKGVPAAKDVDVVRRRWLLIDFDPKKPDQFKDDSATTAERAEAWKVATNVRAGLKAMGLDHPIVASSGNGFHAVYPVDAPNDDRSKELFSGILKGLATRYDTPKATVDPRNYNASRIWKLYGTTSRKGTATEDRPHRPAYVVEHPDDKKLAEGRKANTTALPTLIKAWEKQDTLFSGTEKARTGPDKVARASAYAAKMNVAVSGQGGHNTTFHVVAQIVQGFELTEAEALAALADWNARCQPPWSPTELRHKIRDAIKLATETGKLLKAKPDPPARPAAARTPYDLDRRYTGPETVPEPPVTGTEMDADATVEDLRRLGLTTKWVWPYWFQLGQVVLLCSDAGAGKTRLCADLARRIWRGMPWPDGTPTTIPANSRVMWVCADSQWAELPKLCDQMQIPDAAIVLNARRSNPTGGTMLDDSSELAEFERRILRIKPVLVFVDTGNKATERATHKTDEANSFYRPLAEIAVRTQTTIIVVDHLNAEGKVLGRRPTGSARQVVMLATPDSEGQPDRRLLWVDKSNDVKPPPLGVTIKEDGNEYTHDVPKKAEPERKKAEPKSSPALSKATAFLTAALELGPRAVAELRRLAEEDGISSQSLYRAKDELAIEEVRRDDDRKLWWNLPGKTEPISQGIPI